jgi:hypothetical protein
MHPDAVMTYEYALITVQYFPARLDWHPSPRLRRTARTSPSDAQAVNHNEASFASRLNLNVCSSTLHESRMFQQGPGSIAPNVAEQIGRQFGIAHGVLNIRDVTSRGTHGKGEYHCLVVHNSLLGVGRRAMA